MVIMGAENSNPGASGSATASRIKESSILEDIKPVLTSAESNTWAHAGIDDPDRERRLLRKIDMRYASLNYPRHID